MTKKVTGFSNTEEAALKPTKVVPFRLVDELKQAGAVYYTRLGKMEAEAKHFWASQKHS